MSKSVRGNGIARVMTSSPVIVSLFLLALNDWYLKAAWNNGFTGKLSDFAGVFLLAALLFAVAPRIRGVIACGLVVVFAWWKSPLSQPVIDWVNHVGPPGFGRTVDYTDLVALLMVPAAAWWMDRIGQCPSDAKNLRRWAAAPLLCCALVTMTATSYMRYQSGFDVRSSGEAAVDWEAVAAVAREEAETAGLSVAAHRTDEPGEVFENRWFEMRLEQGDGLEISLLTNTPKEKGQRKMQAFRERLWHRLAQDFDGLEILISLDGNSGY